MPLLEKEHLETLRKNLGIKEANLLLKFVGCGTIKGYYYTRVPICEGHIRIDTVCVIGKRPEYPISVYGNHEGLRRRLHRLQGSSAWIIEIKENLNYEALGQIIVDKFYFPTEYPHLKVKGYAILCKKVDYALKTVAAQHSIQIFTS